MSNEETKLEIALAFEESPYLYDEILEVWFDSDSRWWLKSRTCSRTFKWRVIFIDDGSLDFIEIDEPCA